MYLNVALRRLYAAIAGIIDKTARWKILFILEHTLCLDANSKCKVLYGNINRHTLKLHTLALIVFPAFLNYNSHRNYHAIAFRAIRNSLIN